MSDILFQVPNILPGAAGLISVIGQENLANTVTLTLDPNASLDGSTYNSNGEVTPGSVNIAVQDVVGATDENVLIVANGTGDIILRTGGTDTRLTVDESADQIVVATGTTLAVTDSGGLLSGGIKIAEQFSVLSGVIDATYDADRFIWTANFACQVVAIQFQQTVIENTSAACTLNIMKVPSGTAPSAGSSMLLGGTAINLKTGVVANTVLSATLTVTTANLQLVAGDSIGLDFTTGITEYVGCVTVWLKRI